MHTQTYRQKYFKVENTILITTVKLDLFSIPLLPESQTSHKI